MPASGPGPEPERRRQTDCATHCALMHRHGDSESDSDDRELLNDDFKLTLVTFTESTWQAQYGTVTNAVAIWHCDQLRNLRCAGPTDTEYHDFGVCETVSDSENPRILGMRNSENPRIFGFLQPSPRSLNRRRARRWARARAGSRCQWPGPRLAAGPAAAGGSPAARPD